MSHKIPVKIKLFNSNLPLPAYQSDLAAGFDFYNREPITLNPNETILVKTGVALEIPPEFWLMIAARSSLHKLGLQLINGVGVIDADYCGNQDEIGLLLHNFSAQKVQLEQGIRLAQGVLQSRYQAQFEVVNELTGANRGGIGSTGF